MNRFVLSVLMILMLLSLTACGGEPPIDDGPDSLPQPPEQAEPAPSEAESAGTPADSLSELRENMGHCAAAIADLGFPVLSEAFEIPDYLPDEHSAWLEAYDFVGSIPEERIIRTCGYETRANLLCIVPQDPEAAVWVEVTGHRGLFPQETVDVIYRSEGGEPILLLADPAPEAGVAVWIEDSSGTRTCYIPHQARTGGELFEHSLLDFSPVSPKSAYDSAVDRGWTVPETAFLADRLWRSDCGYELELCHAPGQYFDGDAFLCEEDDAGTYMLTYQGNWSYVNGLLHLHMESLSDSTLVLREDFPVLTDPSAEDCLYIFRAESGVGFPSFTDEMDCDRLYPGSPPEDPYAYALTQGWRLPELSELLNTNWLSEGHYAMDLMDDGAPDDNCGWAELYDVDETGAYTRSYTGSWDYADGMLHLSLIPESGDGCFVDDSFPVLILDGRLWIGRNETGDGPPHFFSDQLADVLEQSMG